MSSEPLPTPAEDLSTPSGAPPSWLVRHRRVLIAVALIATACAWQPARQLQLDESIESFYADDDPHLIAYLQSKRDFGGDEFVMVGYHHPGILDAPSTSITETITESLPTFGGLFGGEETADSEPVHEPDGLDQLQEFADRLSAVPGVNAISTQALPTVLMPPALTSWLERNFIRNAYNRNALIELSRRVLIGDDNETTAVVLRLLPENEAEAPRRDTFRSIREIADAHVPPAFVAGEPVQVHDMFRYVEEDSLSLGLWSTALLMTVILIFFRSLRWTLLPVLIVNVVLIWTQALLYISQLKLSMVSSMLRSLVTIIGIATVMHVTVCYRNYRQSLDRQEAFRETFRQLGRPILWTCLTTAIGFAALTSSEITPVRSFGLMMSLATLLVPVACLLLLPSGILEGRFDADPHAVPGEARISQGLAALSRLTDRYPVVIGLTSLVVVGTAACGLRWLTVETDFSRNFRAESQIVQAITFFEDHLGGVGTWDVSFDVGDSPDFETIDRVSALAEDLRALKLEDGTALTKIVAISDGVELVPNFSGNTLDEKLEFLTKLQPEFVSSLYNPEQHRMRLVLRALERQPAEVKLQLIDAVEETTRRHFPDAKASGLYVLLAHLITSLLADQLVSFGLAGIGIFITMTIAFRSLRIGLISLVPNAFPIVLLIGGLGWTGIPINIGTAMIASVSMGLTVDSSIHYLTAYRTSRREGMSHADAIQAAHGTVGFVLVLANIALIAGFSVLAMSHFIPLVYFGILVSLSMLGGLIGNLLLLPLLLRWAYR